jgi:cytohesin
MEAVSQPEEWFGDDEAEIVRALLKAGADPNRVDLDGTTALHYAAGAGPRAVRLLLNAGADPNARANDGRSSLFSAIEDGLPAVVEALLEGGADPSLPDESGVSPRELVESLDQPDEDQILIREIIRRDSY